MVTLCILCNKPVTNRHQGLLCETCGRWQHRVCKTNITQAEYTAAVSTGTPIEWQCNECSSKEIEIGDDDVFASEAETQRLADMHQMVAEMNNADASLANSDINVSVNDDIRPVDETFRPELHSTALGSLLTSPITTAIPSFPTLSLPPSSPARTYPGPPAGPSNRTYLVSPNRTSPDPRTGSSVSPDRTSPDPQTSPPTSPAGPSPPVSPMSATSPSLPTSPALNATTTFTLEPSILTPPQHEEVSLQDLTPAHVEVVDPPIARYEIVDRGTQRRSKMLVDNAGYSYTMKRAGKRVTLWTCSVRSKTLWCKATIQQKGDKFVEGPVTHQHPASGGMLTATKIRAVIKDRGANEMFTSARVIVDNALSELHLRPEEPVDALPSTDLLERTLNRFRSKQCPEEPTSIEFEMSEEYMPDHFLKRDIRGDNYRHLIFATDSQLHLLSTSKVWYIDATFKVVRLPFVQLFSIHTFVKLGVACKQIPLAFVLMSSRRRSDYELVLSAIRDMLPTPPDLLRIVLDFEMAKWMAISCVFPGVDCMGCGFHWVQCIWRKIQELGLVTLYRDDDGTRQYCRRIMALLFLPAEHIPDMFRELRAKAHTLSLAQLATYVHNTWIDGETWTPARWSVYNQLVRTNNDVEGWHAMLNRAAKRAKLQFYLLIELLHQQTKLVNLQVRWVLAEKLTQRQRLSHRKTQEKMCEAWENYRQTTKTNKDAKHLLDACSKLTAPE